MRNLINKKIFITLILFLFDVIMFKYFQEQYTLVHDAVLETILCGFTEIVAENLSVEVERLEQKERDKSFTGFEIEYKVSCLLNHFLSLRY